MLGELTRVLKRTGGYNVAALAVRCREQEIPVTKRTLSRWFNGRAAPWTVDVVERVAIAAGVDLAFLYPDLDEPVPYVLTEVEPRSDDQDVHEDSRDRIAPPRRPDAARRVRESTFGVSQVDLLAHRLDEPPRFDVWEDEMASPRLFDPIPYTLTDKALAIVGHQEASR